MYLSTASGHTSAYINPSLAYGLTFYCSGFTFSEYALVYWLGPLTGKVASGKMYTLHLIRYLGNENAMCFAPRHDCGSFPLHGTHSEDFFQESSVCSEDTFQSAKRGQRRQENVKEFFSLCFVLITFGKRNGCWSRSSAKSKIFFKQ